MMKSHNMEDEAARPRNRSRSGAWLWALAIAFTLVCAVFQRVTGPSHPVLGSLETASGAVHYKLPRSAISGQELRISLRHVPAGITAQLAWRPRGWESDYTYVPLQRDGDSLSVGIDSLPPGVKIEYNIVLATGQGSVSLPQGGDVVLRFRGDVPGWALLAHILVLVLAIAFGARTLLEAIFHGPGVRPLAWTAFACITLGGMLLGPLVQWYAFGAWWTGIPFGWDLTDNKTLFMLLCWIGVLIAVQRHREMTRGSRRMIIVGAVVMFIVYLIPHSMFGTEVRLKELPSGDVSQPTDGPAGP
jgi:hypothetical protein